MSGRADGRGWNGRGDANAREAGERAGAGPRSSASSRRGGRAPREGGPWLRDVAAGSGPASGADEVPRDGEEAQPGEEALRGAGESPWVRFEDAGRHDPGERPRAGGSAPPLPDLTALLTVLEGVRGMVPRELTDQFNALLRELLLTVRALIDWYLERLDGRPREPEIEEIPID